MSDCGMATIPADICRRLDIEARDELRWGVEEDGSPTVEVIRQRYGSFDDFEPVSMGGDALETHGLAGQVPGYEENA